MGVLDPFKDAWETISDAEASLQETVEDQNIATGVPGQIPGTEFAVVGAPVAALPTSIVGGATRIRTALAANKGTTALVAGGAAVTAFPDQVSDAAGTLATRFGEGVGQTTGSVTKGLLGGLFEDKTGGALITVALLIVGLVVFAPIIGATINAIGGD